MVNPVRCPDCGYVSWVPTWLNVESVTCPLCETVKDVEANKITFEDKELSG